MPESFRAPWLFSENHPKKPLTRVSKRVPGVNGKRSLERGWQRRLAKGWRRRLVKGWRRVGGFRCALQLCNSRNARLEEAGVCDSTDISE